MFLVQAYVAPSARRHNTPVLRRIVAREHIAVCAELRAFPAAARRLRAQRSFLGLLRASQPLYGALATFACAAGFSLGNILAERALNPPRNSGLKPVKAHGYLTAIGGYGLLLGSVCNALWTFPRWNELVGEPMRAAGQTSFFQGAVDDSGNSTSMSVAACFFINMLSSASLNLCYYILVVRCGVVTMAVLSAMNTVIVSLVSHLLFCESSSSGDMNDNAQCITPLSAAASAVVLAGVLLYASMAPPKASKSKTS